MILSELLFTSDPLLDTGSEGYSWTPVINPPQIVNKDGITCAYFNQTGALKCSDPYFPRLSSSNDWCIELWFMGDGNLAMGTSSPPVIMYKYQYGSSNGNGTLAIIFVNQSSINLNNYFGDNVTYSVNINEWHHLELDYNSTEGIGYTFLDGQIIQSGQMHFEAFNNNMFYFALGGDTGDWSGTASRFSGYLRNFRVHDTLLHTSNFVPVMDNRYIALKKGNEVYTQVNGTLSLATESWDTLSSQEKYNIFKNSDLVITDTANLKSLGTIKLLSLQEQRKIMDVITLKAVPNHQLVLPAALFDLSGYETISKITCTGRNKIKDDVAVLCVLDSSISVEKPFQALKNTMGSIQLINDSVLPGGKSLYMDGQSGAYIDNIHTDSIKGDFMIEAWVKLEQSFTGNIIWLGCGGGSRGNLAEGMAFHIVGSDVRFYASATRGYWNIANEFSVANLTPGEWTHIAFTRIGGICKGYKNGILTNSGAISTSDIYFPDNTLAISGQPLAASVGKFNINGIRIIGNTAIYENEFTPPTTYIEPQINNGTVVKIAVTTGDNKYYSFNFTTKQWFEIIPQAQDILESGIDWSDIGYINMTEWEDLVFESKAIGFAYAFDKKNVEDIAELDNMDINIELSGRWEASIHGTDYTYSYPTSNKINVSFLTNGTYRVNYME